MVACRRKYEVPIDLRMYKVPLRHGADHQHSAIGDLIL